MHCAGLWSKQSECGSKATTTAASFSRRARFKNLARRGIEETSMKSLVISRAAVIAMLAIAATGVARAAAALPRLNVDAAKTTVSGLSSGAFMANQLGYAYSATFKGVGVFAGGPYMCAGHSNYTACMYNATISASMLSTMQADINNWSGTANDSKSLVAG